MPTEVFGGHRPPSFRFGLEAIPPLPRLWFVSNDGAELLQVQDNYASRASSLVIARQCGGGT